MKTLTSTLLLVLIWFHLGQSQSENHKPPLTTYSGYTYEYFSIETSDGYHLEPLNLKKGGTKEIRGKAFLQHGLLGSGANWMLSGPRNVS